MNYRPRADELVLWDTWMYPDPENARMHLFFLANKLRGDWEYVGHALSEDLLHWQDCPPVLVRRPGDKYDVGVIGTGMVFKLAAGGNAMSYTANLETERQSIAFLHSTDLLNWEKHLPEPVLYAAPPYYETDPSKAPAKSPAFRDAFVHQVNGRFEALIAAQATMGEMLSRGVIARYRCRDSDLKGWEALKPLLGPDITMLMEVPEHFQIGKKHYLLWSTHSLLGYICETPSRRTLAGTFYAVADSYEGPYHVPAENLLIGAGDCKAIQSYVGRVARWNDELLLYHHLGFPQPSLALPKKLRQHPDGMLELSFWNGCEKLHTRSITGWHDSLELQGQRLQPGKWQSGPRSIKLSCPRGPSLALANIKPRDFHLRCTLTSEDALRVGLSFRDQGQHSQKRGLAFQADFKNGLWQFGEMFYNWCPRIEPVETIYDRPMRAKKYQLDILLRDIYFEAYVDGVWKFTRIVAENEWQGGIGFFVDGGTSVFENIELWELEPMCNACTQ
jgi:sucrose-6-phosphate hydrolase SacC (GH32 family)